MDAGRIYQPYAPPLAHVEDPVPGAARAANPHFFPVGVAKLAAMCACTFGVYQLYWFYRNWKYLKVERGEDVSPIWRAWFFPLWSWALFERVQDHTRQSGLRCQLFPGWLALAVFLFNLSSWLPEPYYLVCLLSFLPLLPVQAAINRLNAEQTGDADRNTRLTGWNLAAVAIGGVMLGLTLVGSFYPPATAMRGPL